MSGAPDPSHWSSSITRAAWTLLFAAFAAYVAWWLLIQLIVPLLVMIALAAIFRLALGRRRRSDW